MSNLRFGIPTLAASALALCLVACVDESPWGNSSNEKGTISLSLSTDFSYDISKPVFSNDDTRAQGDENDLSNYMPLPDVNDFKISLTSKDGKTNSSWSTLTDFQQDLAGGKEFDAGIYTITASYGTSDDTDFSNEDYFTSPYFEASSTFTVIAGRKNEVSLTAELKNAMVAVDYTRDFKDYMSQYAASLEVGGKQITFAADETRPAFVKAGDATITVNFTTKETKKANVCLGTFGAIERNLHKLTFDVKDNDNGFAVLTVTFDESVTDEPLEIDLTEDLYTTPEPEITPVGFESGVTYDWNSRKSEAGLEITGYKMNVLARGGIKTATLGITGVTSPWGSETIDLHTAASATLSGYGVVAQNFETAEKPAAAVLDLTGLVQNLAATPSEFKLYLSVADTYGQTCETVSFTINSQAVSMVEAKEGNESLTPNVTYGASEAQVVLDFNGAVSEAEKVKFYTSSGAEATVKSCEGTRAFETNRYTYTLTLPGNTSISENVVLTAKYNNSTIGSITIPVDVPSYSISDVDAFAHYAYVKIDADPSVLALVTNNIKLASQQHDLTIVARDTEKGILTLTNLSDNTTYSVKSSITDKTPAQPEMNIQTEEAKAIPNGNFSSANSQLSIEKLTVGGKWFFAIGNSSYGYHYSSILYDVPDNWSTINDITANPTANYLCSWYVVASSWCDSGRGFMRNVGYNPDGRVVGDSKGTHTDHYCRTSPNDDDFLKAAGVLSLGSYNFETGKSDGISFSGRPNRISFDYEFHNYAEFDADKSNNNKKNKYTFADDKGYAFIQLLNDNGKIIAEETFILSAGTGTESMSLNYDYKEKANKLRVIFKSSNKSNSDIEIHIPKNEELSEGDTNGFATGDKTFKANQYHALARGSELWIDNVTAHYDNAPALKHNNAKKRK